MDEYSFEIYLTNKARHTEQNPVAEWVQLPTDAEKMKAVFARIGVDGSDPEQFEVAAYASPTDGLTERFSPGESIDELNYLAALLMQRSDEEREKFAAALIHGDHAANLSDIINLTHNLDCYWIYPTVHTSEDYGHYLIDELDELELPEAAKKYFDYKAYGRDSVQEDRGTFTDYGYIYNNNNQFAAWYDRNDIPQEYRLTSDPAIMEDRPFMDAPPPPVPVRPIDLTATDTAGRVKEITAQLEQGVKDLFASQRYQEYLKAMSKFHDYSLNNTLLIVMQKPDASLVAGYGKWRDNFERHVKRGEKGIKILAPAPYKVKREIPKIDPDSGQPIIGKDGKPVTEEKEITIPNYKVVSVFDVSQTEGKEIPDLSVDSLTGGIEQYEDFFRALERTSPVPVSFEPIPSGAHGYYSNVDKRIAINEGESELQTVKTLIHEIAHAKLHDIDLTAATDEQSRPNRRTREVESIAYTVCQHFGLDTSDYSFGYIAGWSSDKEITELKASLETIRATASELITEIEGHFAELQQRREAQAERPDASKAVGNTFSIYQLKGGEETRDYRFEPLERLQAVGLKVDRANYELVYTAPLRDSDTLEDIYRRFNIDHPQDFTGHSLSVSDIVVLHHGDHETAHYCDSIGFKEVPEFLQEQTIQQEAAQPVFDNITPEQQQAIRDEVQETLQMLVNTDLQLSGEVSQGTLDALAAQGYVLQDGQITKAPQEEAPSVTEQPESEKPPAAELTDLQKKAVEIAKGYESLPMQDKIGIIAQAFGCTSGKIETSPCTGKWRGTSDVSIKFDNGKSLFIGNHRTPAAKTKTVQQEFVNAALVQFNPEIISAAKEAAMPALMEREAKDNAIAEQKGLKPYTLLNVEFNDGTDDKASGYMGWYYVTLAVDGKICSHMETGLNHDIADGKVSAEPTRENYFTAGALKETDVDYVFNNVGFSSASELYSLHISDAVRERAEKTLAEREKERTEDLAATAEEKEDLPPSLDPAVQPVVTIIWSESDKLREGDQMPLARADALFKALDEEKRAERERPDYTGGWYDKTKFRIDFTFQGERDSYEGRQDFGDGDGSLIQHIQDYHAYYQQDENWKNFVIHNQGAEAWEQDKAEREMILTEFIPYMELHRNLYEMEQTAARPLESGEALTPEQTAYFNAVLAHVDVCREMLNNGDYALPEPPQFSDFSHEAAEMEAYKAHVEEEIAQEAAAAGMTVEEYAANGYEAPEQPDPVPETAQEAEQPTEQEQTIVPVKYYPINETAARRANDMNSYRDYVPGSATAEYRSQVDAAAEIAQRQKSRVDPMYHEKIDQLLDTYARRLAENMNSSFAIESRVPSILVAGGSNFPVRKKEKQNAARDRNMEDWQDVQGILDKIRSTGMGGISADDPQAVAKLEAKLAKLEAAQETMKGVNAYYRKHGTLEGCTLLKPEQIKELQDGMAQSWHLEKNKPFQSFELSNNNAEIRRIRERIEGLKKHEAKEYVGWEFDGGRVEANKTENRLQIFFDEKPDDAARAELKENGFRWAPSAGAWQRQLNDNAYYAAGYVSCIQPTTGEKPIDLQRQAQRQQQAPTPDALLTGEQITTPRGSFHLTAMSVEQMREAGYGVHHTSDDGKYYIMGNGTQAYAVAVEQPENYLKNAEMSTEQNYNMIDGSINNTPSVDELEEKAKRGEVISLSALAAAVKAEDGKTPQRGKEEKKPSIRAQLKADQKQAASAPKKDKEQKRSIKQDLERG